MTKELENETARAQIDNLNAQTKLLLAQSEELSIRNAASLREIPAPTKTSR